MEIRFAPYYEQFRCIAAACPDSCCKEWAVDVDAQSAALYRSLPGNLGNQLRRVLKNEKNGAVMTIENGRCPMWRQDGLCQIQACLGHDALCETCRNFPRLRHDYGDFVELGLELSCPEAARHILSADTWKLCSRKVSEQGTGEYDRQVMEKLLQSRERVLSFLEESDYTPGQTLAIILMYSHRVQSWMDGGQIPQFRPEVELAVAKQYGKTRDMAPILDFFCSLEILTEDWKARLEWGAVQTASPISSALMGYMVQRYWLQAVSDFDLICRVKLAVTACLLVSCLGGDIVQTAQQFSKEIENDPDNIAAILDSAYTCPAFTDAALLGALLNT